MGLHRTQHLAGVVLDSFERPLYFLKTNAARSPRLALPLAWLQGKRELVDEETDILIESFPRCASSFAITAFRLAQEPRVPRVASQTHAPGHVIAAVRRNVPALVLSREPEDAVVSNLFRHPELGVDGLLRGYLRFYEPLLPYRTGFVAATFEEVIEDDFGSVIRRVNKRFGTDFAEYPASEENMAPFRWTDNEGPTQRSHDEEILETIPRPSELRERMKEELRAHYRATATRRLHHRAENLYEHLAR